MEVALVGGGASGALVALQLGLESYSGRLTWFAREAPLAGGLAYGCPEPWHLLNVPAGRLSAIPADGSHFTRWLARRRAGSTADSFAPRALYRDYLVDTVRTYGAPYALVEEAVIALDRTGSGFALRTASGARHHADVVVLAAGHQPPRDFPQFQGDSRWIRDPWRSALPVVDGAVVLVGTGLTMADVALTVARQSTSAKILAFSRHGLAPLAHVGAPPRTTDLAPMPLRELVRRVRDDVRSHDGPWQAVIDGLRPHLPGLWNALDDSDRRRFLRHVRRYWDVHRHRVAPEVANELARLRHEGRLEILRGRLKSVRRAETLKIELDSRTIDAALAVNCTGPTADVTRTTDPLLRHLLGTGLAAADPLGLGLRADADGTLLDAENRAVPGLFTLGPPLLGARWETTAIPEIRAQAATLARQLADASSPAGRPSGTLPAPWP